MAKILITGASSGLGAKMLITLAAETLNRTKIKKYQNRLTPYDLTVHCAFERYDHKMDEVKYINRAVKLTEKVASIPSKRLVFISSIECNSLLDNNAFVKAKNECERVVSKVPNSLNLRVPSLYGGLMRKNQIFKIATEKYPILSLSNKSIFSLLDYNDIANFLISSRDVGIISLVSDFLKLEDIAEYFGTEPIWGTYVYKTQIGKNKFVKVNLGKSLDLYKNFVDNETYKSNKII